MRPRELMYRLLDVIETTELDAPYEDFVRASERLLALLISRLDPADREAALQAIEDGGALRRLVDLFPGARMAPEVPYGYRH